MKCPFCRRKLTRSPYEWYTIFICFEPECIYEEMSRYQVTYRNYPTYIMAKTFMLDKYYIQIDYEENQTTISVLEICVLLDPVVISQAMSFDLTNIQAAAQKIKTLMVFS